MTPAARWIAPLGRWQRGGLAFLAGALMTAGHAPVDFPWTLFLAVPVLVLLVAHAPRPAAAAWVGWAAGFGYFVTGLHWIGYAFLVEPDRFAWLLPLGTAVLPAGLAVFWAMGFWLARRFWPGNLLLGLPWMVAVWTLVEYARGNVLTGFPWALPGYVWVETPAMQAAAWIGPYAITLVTLLLTAIPGAALLAVTGRGRWAGVALPLAAGVALWAAGSARVLKATAYVDDPIVVRVVQPNAPQAQKWRPGYREQFYNRAVVATADEASPTLGIPDVVIWPETAMPFLPASNPEKIARVAGLAAGAHLLAGALHAEGPRDTVVWYNSFFPILPDGSFGPRYDKHHLVPFGEYLPFPGILEALGLRQFAIQGEFGRGAGPATLRLEGLPPFSPLICYEAIFPHEIVGAERPDWLVQITNDAWFGPFAGPQQHLAQARIRAIEQGLPMVRAANTGISAVIDSHGRIMARIELDTYGAVDARLPAPLQPTLYARFGDLPFWALMVLLLVGPVALSRLRRA